jgi:putative Ca2+/H+ antiporter (TMEM165/GDT1 family)
LSLTLAVTVYGTVLLAELAGDKTLYTVGSLSTQHRSAPVFAGAAIAVALKMLAAVLLGGVLARLPPLAVSSVSAITFVAMALGIWRAKLEVPEGSDTLRRSWTRGLRAAFLAIFLTEWGDLGQLTAAALAAAHGERALVWAFASLAMLTKVSIATVFAIGFRRWVPRRVLRLVSISVCLLMAVLAAAFPSTHS